MTDLYDRDDLPLGPALRAMREHAGRSLDEVAHYGWSDERRLSGSQIGQIERGTKSAQTRTLLAILRGIGLGPSDYPPVVRLALARRELDEREVGLDRAVAFLRRLEDGAGITSIDEWADTAGVDLEALDPDAFVSALAESTPRGRGRKLRATRTARAAGRSKS